MEMKKLPLVLVFICLLMGFAFARLRCDYDDFETNGEEELTKSSKRACYQVCRLAGSSVTTCCRLCYGKSPRQDVIDLAFQGV